MAEFFHVIEIKGNLIFESIHEDFRVALVDYLRNFDTEGVQVCISNARGKEKEDAVIQMRLIRMKQNPGILAKPVPSPRKVPVKATATASDTCFY